jgi:hypothetical protein
MGQVTTFGVRSNCDSTVQSQSCYRSTPAGEARYSWYSNRQQVHHRIGPWLRCIASKKFKKLPLRRSSKSQNIIWQLMWNKDWWPILRSYWPWHERPIYAVSVWHHWIVMISITTVGASGNAITLANSRTITHAIVSSFTQYVNKNI